MKESYTYKFTENGYDYYRCREDMRMVKVREELPGGRSDEVISKHCINAEDDFEVYEYYSE
jgi:hypothetical protein